MEKILIIGAGGHAKTIADTINKDNLYEIVGFIDKGQVGEKIYQGYKIIGSDDMAKALFGQGVHNAIIGIGFMGESHSREKIAQLYKNIGYRFPPIIDSTAIIANDVHIDEGTYIGRQVVVNANAQIGKFCIINTGAIIEHESKVGDFSHIAVGGVICGRSYIGKKTFIGANSTIIQCLKVGNDCIVGAGAVVIKNIDDGKKVVGNPAKEILSKKVLKDE